MAKHFNAETIFLHAVPSFPYEAAFVTSMPGGGAAWTPGPELEESLRKQLAQLVEEVAPGHAGERLVVNGPVGRVIEGAVKRLGVDLIVMPTSGAGPFRRFLLGSVTAQVLSDTECPVLTGPHMDNMDAFALRPYRRVGCAVDLDQTAERVVKAAAGLAAAYRAELVAIHALPLLSVGGRGAFGASEMDKLAREHATAEITQKLKPFDAEPKIILEQGQPEDVIPKVAKENGIDVLVIGRHGERGLLGGLKTRAYGIIRRSECPILSV